jgi:hypothetical protein
MARYLLGGTLLVMLLLAACSASEISDAAGSPSSRSASDELTAWVDGLVVAGPVCPVESVSPDPTCADRPVAGAVLVFEYAAGGEVARVATAPDGTFRVELPEGRYRVIPQPVEGLLGTAGPIDLVINPGEPVSDLVIAYDTGIR